MSDVLATHISLHQKSRILEIHFSDATIYELPCEYLRVFSPSAEVRVAKNRGECITGKELVGINRIEPIGQYAIRLVFDDGHKSGIYSWKTLKDLGENFTTNWQDYQHQLAQQRSQPVPADQK